MLNFSLSKRQEELQEEVIEFARRNLNEGIEYREKEQIFDRKLWKECGKIGLPGLTIPESYGGRGLGAVSTTLALEALGYGSEDSGLNFALAAHLLACVVPIWIYGSEMQKKQWIPSLCNGQWIAANAMTEHSSGSDIFQMKSLAKRTEEGYLLTGHKTYCSNAPVADLVLTYALTNSSKGFFGGISSFVLEKEKHAFQTTSPISKLGLPTCHLGEVSFNDLAISEENILGMEGAGGVIFNKSMEWERICLGALHLGTMKRHLENVVQFVNERHSGGQSIGKNQAIAHKIAQHKVQIEAARMVTMQAAWKLDNNHRVTEIASTAKYLVSKTFEQFAVDLLQIYGGAGYRENHPAGRLLKDAVASTVYSGTSEMQLNIIARRMGIT